MTRRPTENDRYRINFSWLLRLRWAAIAGQAAVIGIVSLGLGLTLAGVPISVILAFEVVSNVYLVRWLGRAEAVREHHIGLVVALDLVLFSALLYFTGGPSNPFSFLYLIHIALAALVLRPRWMWGLVALSLLCSGALFIDHVPLQGDAMHAHHDHQYGMHLRGMWLALGVAAAFIVYFLHRVTSELASKEAELGRAREEAVRHERLAALATLAAGAAHELATPLSTIAVVTKELEQELAGQGVAGASLADVELIRAQVARCREVLSRMATDAGQTPGEAAREITLDELSAAALADLPEAQRVACDFPAPADRPPLSAPLRPLAQVLRSVLSNALEASTEEVKLSARRLPKGWRLEVVDSGTGMSAEVLARAVEPFYSTKEPGRGMGLGLFLAQSVTKQLGGELGLSSEPGRGTRVSIDLPDPGAAKGRRAGPDLRAPRGRE